MKLAITGDIKPRWDISDRLPFIPIGGDRLADCSCSYPTTSPRLRITIPDHQVFCTMPIAP
ncbi:hypothetical protein J0895_01580 [Phormidium pseudopriestleyi FRX01]|uniref:Uncharacterized protein n=1 Tax=Phormidium pseudopriestleyi FRX01 TaxID=1759528 RepID=A0ABS3FL43_9CYAN|nr:hypothetical protein [Phormidium pseudopriestleyi]MBO0347819.1 hypothetical protein [Phormidium pseudopriestleyi FRX01]